MWHLAIPGIEIAARSAIIYLALWTGLRFFGKREVGQFTLFDLVLVLLVANAVQPAMTGPDSSVTGGLIIIATLFLLNRAVAVLRPRSPFFRRLVEGRATIIARDGHWLQDALRREELDDDDCLMALREHGFDNVSEVSLAVLETDGTISVVPARASMQKGQRRVRTRKL